MPLTVVAKLSTLDDILSCIVSNKEEHALQISENLYAIQKQEEKEEGEFVPSCIVPVNVKCDQM